MPLKYRRPSEDELKPQIARYGAYFMIPAEIRDQQIPVLATTREGLCDQLADLGAEADEIRASGHIFTDVRLAMKQREMEMVRQAIEALPVQSMAAE